MMIAFWILVWVIGALFVYCFAIAMEDSHPATWDSDKRVGIGLVSLCSWATVALFVLLAIIALPIMGLCWLIKKYIGPPWGKFQTWVYEKTHKKKEK